MSMEYVTKKGKWLVKNNKGKVLYYGKQFHLAYMWFYK